MPPVSTTNRTISKLSLVFELKHLTSLRQDVISLMPIASPTHVITRYVLWKKSGILVGEFHTGVMDDNQQVVPTGRFEKLKDYFDGVRYVDLKETISPVDLFNAAKPEHKLLMKIYSEQVLQEYFSDPFASKAVTVVEVPKYDNFEIQDEKLDLRSKVISSEFTEFPSLSSRPTLDVALNRVLAGKKHARVVDLSCNQLLDCDMICVVNFVEELKCSELNISFNRFHGLYNKDKHKVAECLLKILRKDWVKILNIVGNPFASIDQKGFFDSLTDEDFQKFVWIPKPWLAGTGWKQVVPLEKYHHTILNTHSLYYK